MNKDVSNTSEPLLVNAKVAAKILDISVRNFRAMHATGALGPMPIRLGRLRKWRTRELSDWVDAGCPARGKWISRIKD